MGVSEKIKRIRRRAFLNQVDFAKTIGVSFVTVNRWENGKSIPNLKTLKLIDDYCKRNGVNFDVSAELDSDEEHDYAESQREL